MQEKTLAGKKIYAEIAGWYGACAIVLAYALISFKVIDADSFIHHILNLTGAIGIIVISTVKRVPQPAVLNAFRAAIATVAIIGLLS